MKKLTKEQRDAISGGYAGPEDVDLALEIIDAQAAALARVRDIVKRNGLTARQMRQHVREALRGET